MDYLDNFSYFLIGLSVRQVTEMRASGMCIEPGSPVLSQWEDIDPTFYLHSSLASDHTFCRDWSCATFPKRVPTSRAKA